MLSVSRRNDETTVWTDSVWTNLVQAKKSQFFDDLNSTYSPSGHHLACNLQTNLHNLQRIREHHLRPASLEENGLEMWVLTFVLQHKTLTPWNLAYFQTTTLPPKTLTVPPATHSAHSAISPFWFVNLSLTRSFIWNRTHKKISLLSTQLYFIFCSYKFRKPSVVAFQILTTSPNHHTCLHQHEHYSLAVSLMAFSGATPTSCGGRPLYKPLKPSCLRTYKRKTQRSLSVGHNCTGYEHLETQMFSRMGTLQKSHDTHLLKAIEAVFVHEFSHVRASPLVLQSSLHQVDRVHSSSTNSCTMNKQFL